MKLDRAWRARGSFRPHSLKGARPIRQCHEPMTMRLDGTNCLDREGGSPVALGTEFPAVSVLYRRQRRDGEEVLSAIFRAPIQVRCQSESHQSSPERQLHPEKLHWTGSVPAARSAGNGRSRRPLCRAAAVLPASTARLTRAGSGRHRSHQSLALAERDASGKPTFGRVGRALRRSNTAPQFRIPLACHLVFSSNLNRRAEKAFYVPARLTA